MTEKELLYTKDVLDQGLELKEVVNYYKSIINDDDLLNLLDDIENNNDKEYKKLSKFL